MRNKAVISIWLGVVLLALPAAVSWAIDTLPTWEPREAVFTHTEAFWSNHVGQHRILAYDHHGNPGIAFSRSSLYYARRAPGIGWAAQSLGMGGPHPSLAFDRHERPAIASYDSGDTLKYSTFDGSAWQHTTVGAASYSETRSLAFDIYGNPAIFSGHRYFHDRNGNGDWADDGIPSAPFEAQHTFGSLAFDGLNRPMVSAYRTNSGEIDFAVLESGDVWGGFRTIDQVVATPPDTDSGYPSLAIDPDTGFPAIAYYDELNGHLKYAGWTGSEWIIEAVDTASDTGLYPSLAFDPADGNPAIAYFDATATSLKLAFHDGGSWQIQTVDDVGDIGYCPSLAFNDYGTGFPSIAYFGADTLYFIEDPPVPEPATLALLLTGGSMVLARRRRGV